MDQITKRYQIWRMKIFFITWLAYVGLYLTRKSFSVVKTSMLADSDLGLTKPDLGQMDFCFLLFYAIGQFVMGIYGDRLGARLVVLGGTLGSIIIAILVGCSSTLWVFLILFSLHGFVQASGWAPLAKNLTCWFVRKERGWMMGWWSTNYTVGGSIAAALSGFCAEYFLGWRFAFFGSVLALSAVWFLFVLLQRDRPEDVGLSSQELEDIFDPQIKEQDHLSQNNQNNIGLDDTNIEKQQENHPQDHTRPCTHVQADKIQLGQEASHSWADTKAVLSNYMVWLLAWVYFCLKPIRYIIFFWGPLYLNEYLGTGIATSAIISTGFEWGGFVGVITGGYLSDYLFQSRRIPLSVISLTGLGFLMFFFHGIVCTGSQGLALAALCAMGFLLYVPDSLLSGAAAMDFGTKRGASTAAGFINGCGSIGAIVGGSLPGWLEGSAAWKQMFTIIGYILLFCVVTLAPFWNAKPKKN